MKFRQAAALALVVWLMMIPPTRGAPAAVLYHAPLSQWEVNHQYHSKAECENAIPSDKDVEEIMKQCFLGSCVVREGQLANGSCMASDDPQLKDNADVKRRVPN